jgi:hypothetical protein
MPTYFLYKTPEPMRVGQPPEDYRAVLNRFHVRYSVLDNSPNLPSFELRDPLSPAVDAALGRAGYVVQKEGG